MELAQCWSGDAVKEGGEERAVKWCETWLVDLALQDGQLVVQDHDLSTYRAAWSMDTLHELAARVGSAATARFGFALAGRYAVPGHGFVERPSEDVDLFTVVDAPGRFDQAVTAAN